MLSIGFPQAERAAGVRCCAGACRCNPQRREDRRVQLACSVSDHLSPKFVTRMKPAPECFEPLWSAVAKRSATPLWLAIVPEPKRRRRSALPAHSIACQSSVQLLVLRLETFRGTRKSCE